MHSRAIADKPVYFFPSGTDIIPAPLLSKLLWRSSIWKIRWRPGWWGVVSAKSGSKLRQTMRYYKRATEYIPTPNEGPCLQWPVWVPVHLSYLCAVTLTLGFRYWTRSDKLIWWRSREQWRQLARLIWSKYWEKLAQKFWWQHACSNSFFSSYALAEGIHILHGHGSDEQDSTTSRGLNSSEYGLGLRDHVDNLPPIEWSYRSTCCFPSKRLGTYGCR